MFKYLTAIVLLSLSFFSFSKCLKLEKSNLAFCKYERFDVWLSCKQKAAILSHTILGQDFGSENTSNRSYFLDKEASELNCQQISKKTYTSEKKGFDVGHLIAIDHFDDNKRQALQTNTMVNMVPQASSFNRTGAWKKTESLTECYRDDPLYSPLTIYAGVIYGNDKSNDHYSISHGLPKTPDYLWKLIYSESLNKYELWVMLNNNTSRTNTLKSSRKSINALIEYIEDENDPMYLPVLKTLIELNAKSPENMELINTADCHRRLG
jgi:DNA/RNA endonuclease G (NUC1)